MRLRRSIGTWAAVGGLTIVMGNIGWCQLGNGNGNGRGSQSNPSNGPVLPSISPTDMGPTPQMADDQAKMRNVDRQKQLVLDTQKLLALANELKSDVDKSNKDTMSLDVIRKADEIEKLAHSVKEKMKGT